MLPSQGQATGIYPRWFMTPEAYKAAAILIMKHCENTDDAPTMLSTMGVAAELLRIALGEKVVVDVPKGEHPYVIAYDKAPGPVVPKDAKEEHTHGRGLKSHSLWFPVWDAHRNLSLPINKARIELQPVGSSTTCIRGLWIPEGKILNTDDGPVILNPTDYESWRYDYTGDAFPENG